MANFPLRLPPVLDREARDLAERMGMSFNAFVSMCVFRQVHGGSQAAAGDVALTLDTLQLQSPAGLTRKGPAFGTRTGPPAGPVDDVPAKIRKPPRPSVRPVSPPEPPVPPTQYPDELEGPTAAPGVPATVTVAEARAIYERGLKGFDQLEPWEKGIYRDYRDRMHPPSPSKKKRR